jgi:hemerythrin
MWEIDGGIMWKDNYSIGVKLIDDQHKELFENATEGLLGSIQSPDAYRHKQHCINTITFLKGYVVKHFEDEEAYQRSIGYAGYAVHKRQHLRLAKEVGKFEKRLVSSNFALPVIKRFMAFVLRWLMHHVAEEDRKIGKTVMAPSA